MRTETSPRPRLRWLVGALAGLALLLAALAAYSGIRYGSIEPCGVLRAKARLALGEEKGLLAAVGRHASDSILDVGLREMMGRDLTPWNCAVALASGPMGDRQDKPKRTTAGKPSDAPVNKQHAVVMDEHLGVCKNPECNAVTESASYQAYQICLAKAKRDGKPFNADTRNTCRGIAYQVWLNTGGWPLVHQCNALPEPQLDHIYRC